MKKYEGMKYSKEHEWVREQDGLLYIGITDFAQNALGDIVFVEVPDEGKKIKAGEQIAVIESVKTASDVYSPVSGTVTKANDSLTDAPELLNEGPYENWIAAVEASDMSELEGLMNEEQYDEFCSKEE